MHLHKTTTPKKGKKRFAAFKTYYTVLVCEKLGLEPTEQNRQRVRNVRAGRTNDVEMKLAIAKIQNETRKKEKEIAKLESSE